jgi:hypothetical protein
MTARKTRTIIAVGQQQLARTVSPPSTNGKMRMAERPTHIEVSISDGSDQVMFTLVYADGYRSVYWLTGWRGIWHMAKLIWRGFDVRYEERN